MIIAYQILLNCFKDIMKLHLLLIFIFFSIQSITPQNFTGSFDLIAEQNYPNGNARSDTISYYFGNEKTAIVIHDKRNQPDMRMVFHPADSAITALFEINGKKSGYILPMNDQHWPGMRHAFRSLGTRPKTETNYSGEAKAIEGYLCRKAIAESSDYDAVLWIAEDIPLSMMRVLSYQTVGEGKSQKELEQFDQFGAEGLPLEMHLTSKKGKADVTIRLENFKEEIDDSIFSIEGHSINEVE